jgi:hypothetical protein
MPLLSRLHLVTSTTIRIRTRIPARRRLLSTVSSSCSTQRRQDLILALQGSVPNADFQTNRYELERHGRGESYHPTRPPDAIISPTSVDEVVTIVQYCNQHHIPIVPFGAGTSVEGHVCCLQGGLVSTWDCFSRWTCRK